MDIVDKAQRSRMMSGIRGKDTKPEMIIRKALHKRGFRYRLHDRKLPGRPDLVLPKYRAAIQVQGCYWHGHGCHLFKWPSTRIEFWETKITSNISRDHRNLEALREMGWKTAVIWECALKGKNRLDPILVVNKIEQWLSSEVETTLEIAGSSTLNSL